MYEKLQNSEKIKKVVEVVKELPVPKKYPISVVSGISVILTFWIFVFVSIIYFQGFYNPYMNWMSDLGNSEKNPEGALFFNIGCIISGIVMFAFFIGLYEWYIGGKRNRNLTILTQIAGFYVAFALIMIGVFPIDYPLIHGIWAVSLFIASGFTFIFPAIALYKYKFTRNIAKFGLFGTGVNAILWIFFYPIMEWVTILLSFVYIGIIIYSMQKRIEKLRFVRHQHIEIHSKKKNK